MEHNCGFTENNKWFRYRAAAIIVEDGYVLFAGNEKDGFTQGVKENMYWLPIAELDKYKAFPSFMKEYLQTEHAGIEHIVSDERTEK